MTNGPYLYIINKESIFVTGSLEDYKNHKK
jgi:hypothetical protein